MASPPHTPTAWLSFVDDRPCGRVSSNSTPNHGPQQQAGRQAHAHAPALAACMTKPIGRIALAHGPRPAPCGPLSPPAHALSVRAPML